MIITSSLQYRNQIQVAWYFSLLIVTILPNDISATFYQQCMKDYEDQVSTTKEQIEAKTWESRNWIIAENFHKSRKWFDLMK